MKGWKMKTTKLFLNLTVLLVGTLFLSSLVKAGTEYFVLQDNAEIFNTDSVYVDANSPPRKWAMSTFGWGLWDKNNTISHWNLGDYTGITIPTPLEKWQRGVNPGWPGSSAVVMNKKSSGCQNHTWSLPRGINHSLANCQIKYRWELKDNRRPWDGSANSQFEMAFTAKVPSAYMTGGAVGYVYASILLQDENGKKLWIQPQMFDTRGAPSKEYVGWDAGTNSAFANTYFRYSNYGIGRYISKAPYSSESLGSLWGNWKLWQFSINRSQLQTVIMDINSRFGSGLSMNVWAYKLILVSVQNEIAWSKGDGHLGMGVNGIKVWESY